MADFSEQQQRDYNTVTLVDRTGRGGTEIIFDGIRLVFPKGVAEKSVPQYVAAWLFQAQKHMVWTQEGQYVNRFGLKDPSEELLASVGPDAGDLSPITMDGARLEGWDTSDVDRSRTRTIELNPPKQNERQGSFAATFGDRKG